MPKGNGRRDYQALPEKYQAFHDAIAKEVSASRIFCDPFRTLAHGTDASFYRLIPKIVVKVRTPEEIVLLLRTADRLSVPVTFRAAGTSLSGQAVTDSVLAVLAGGWRKHRILDGGERIALEPGIIGAEANAFLAPFGRKIGPDPASINHCMIGGIAANNASGMCCGTAQNSYRTVESMKVILHDGTLLDTADRSLAQGLRGIPPGDGRGDRADPGRDPRGRSAAAAHRGEVPRQEHHRLRRQRLRGPRRPGRHPPAPDDRIRGNAGVYRGDHLPNRGGARPQGVRPDDLPRHRERVPRCHAPENRPGLRRGTDGPGVASFRGGQGRDAGVPEIPRRGGDGAPRRDAGGRRRGPRPADGGGRGDALGDPHRAPGRLHGPEGRVRQIVAGPQGALPGGGRGAAGRHHRGDRGCGVPHRAAGRRHSGTRANDAEARLRRGDPLRPRPGREPSLRLHPGLRRPERGGAVPALHGRSVRPGREEVRRIAQRRARHGTEHGPLRGDGVGGADLRPHAAGETRLRPEGAV